MNPWLDDGDVRLYHGDVREVLRALPEQSAQTCVTSPPYYGLRDYGAPRQIGLEDTPDEYVAALADVFREVRRVLRDDGTLWLNLGDSYAANPSGGLNGTLGKGGQQTPHNRGLGRRPRGDVKHKDLLGIPWRVALALQADGWYLRCDVIWSKRNMMPDPAPDRPSRSHEYVFLLSKRERYFYAADAIREDSDPEQEAHNQRYAREYAAHTDRAAATGQPGNVNNIGVHSRPGPGGRNKRSVWTVSSQPYPGAHFATFPPKLIEPCILAGCPEGGTVLDPFSGSGTTAWVARHHGRHAIGIDLSEDYLKLSASRLQQLSLLGDAA